MPRILRTQIRRTPSHVSPRSWRGTRTPPPVSPRSWRGTRTPITRPGVADGEDENTAIGREIEKRLGVPAIIKAWGPENRPKVQITPLPSIDPARVIRYQSSGHFLFPVIKEIKKPKRFEMSRTVFNRHGLGNYGEPDIYELSGFFSIMKSAVPALKKFGTKFLHPVKSFRKFAPISRLRKFRTKRQFKKSIRTVTTRQAGTVTTPSGKKILGSLLTMKNLEAAKGIFPSGSGMEDTYQDLLDNRKYVEAADFAETYRPGIFGGSTTSDLPGWLIPAAVVGGGLLYARSKKMI